MPKCIYSLKNHDDSKFSSQEHVLPACIGGMHKLPKGYVSDEVNEMFSQLELYFARESPISIPRILLGPGKRGSLNPKKETASKISVISDTINKGKALGFIKKGKPFIIDQVHFFNDHNPPKIRISLDPSSEKTNSELLLNFWETMKAYTDCPNIIKDDALLENERILGFYEKRWHLAINKNCNIEEAMHSFTIVVKNISNIINESMRIADNGYMTESQVTSHLEMVYKNDLFRVIAKTVFNCLAYIMGSSFVLNKAFDSIRSAIYTGKNIEKYINVINKHYILSETLKAPHASEFGSHLHMITIFRVETTLMAEVCFYGCGCAYLVKIADEFYDNFDLYDGIICDWQNKRELRFAEFIQKICGVNV